MNKICCIISAGDVNRTLLQKNKSDYTLFIAADLGYEKALESGIFPSILVGDFDSLGQFNDNDQKFVPDFDKTKLVPYPIEKNLSDTHLAIEEGIKLGYQHFHVYGALGGDRFSHSIANLQTLCAMKSKGICVTLMGEKEIVYLLQNETLLLTPPIGSTFSLFSLSKESTNITITGAKYSLTDATLTNDYPLGLSNQSICEQVSVSAGDGYLLLILEL